MRLLISLVCCVSVALSSTALGQPIDLLGGNLLSQWVAADGSPISGSNWTVDGGVNGSIEFPKANSSRMSAGGRIQRAD